MIANMNIEGISVYGNTMFKIFMIIGGAATIPAGQALFSKLFGSGEFTDKNRIMSVREVYNILHGSYNAQMGGVTELAGSNKYSEDSRNFDLGDGTGGEYK